MSNYFIFEGKLPSLNNYIEKCRVHAQVGACFKREWQSTVSWQIVRDKGNNLLRPITKPCRVHFHYYEKSLKRDVDNIAGFAHKIILDALVTMGILPNDTQKWVKGFTDTFNKSDNDCIKVEIEEVD